MTGQLLPRLTDQRLDRLVVEFLAERAEEVASAALPADAVAERIAMRLRRPAYGSRVGLALVAAVALLLVGLVTAVVVGWRPAPTTPTPLTFECRNAPSYPGEQSQFSLRDETGLITDCREVEAEEALAIRDRFGPPLVSFDGVTIEITKANEEGTLLLVIWTNANCDLTATLDLTSAVPDHIDLVVGQEKAGRCAPGSGLRAVELAFNKPLPPDNVSSVLNRNPGGP